MSVKELRKIIDLLEASNVVPMVDFPGIADATEKLLHDWHNDLQDKWGDEPDMISMFEEDFQDSLEVIRHLRAGHIIPVIRKVGDMDTGARDQIGGMIAKAMGPKIWDKYFVPRGWISHANMFADPLDRL